MLIPPCAPTKSLPPVSRAVQAAPKGSCHLALFPTPGARQGCVFACNGRDQIRLLPQDVEDAVLHFKDGPLVRARQPLVSDLVKGLSTDLLLESRSNRERTRQFSALGALYQLYPQWSTEALDNKLQHVLLRVSDGDWYKVIILVHNVANGWTTLGHSAQNKSIRFIANCDSSVLSMCLAQALDIPQLHEYAAARIPENGEQNLGR